MRGGPRVVWIKGSRVFHREYRAREVTRTCRRPGGGFEVMEVTVARCGAVISVEGLWRGQTGTRRQAEALGLRGCRRAACFPTRTATFVSEQGRGVSVDSGTTGRGSGA